MPLSSGHKLGPYEIVSPLGAGGMGEVYRARDAKLKRDVAIKVLPADVANDRERLARFQREAEVLASLNHPHIAHVYGVEENALVMELVEGDDLSQQIARGPIPLDEALAIAKQIAEALEAAHDVGIVHRDLKPGNIKVREDGTVKVLDFGLAKAGGAGQAGGEIANSPTITSPAMTMRGVILGTAAYMSPEQAKGKAVDKRADIWAFGCVLFELLTGTRAFKGDDITDIITSVMRDTPDWNALPATTPASIRMLLRRCLEKDPRRRLRDIGEARFALEEGSVADSRPGTAPERSRSAIIAPWAVAGALAIALAVIAWPGRAALPVASGNVTRFEFAVPENFTQITPRPASMAITNDGGRVAFLAGNSTSRVALFVRDMSALESREIQMPGTGTTWLTASPSWSPDGRFIVITTTGAGGFESGPGVGGAVRRLDFSGGPPTTIAEWGRYAVWGTDGVIVYGGRDGRIYRVPEGGGASTPITELDASAEESAHLPTSFLPDGRRFIFMSQNRESEKNAVFVASIDGGARIPLAVPGTRVVFAGGWVWYIQDNALMAQRMDGTTARLDGGPTAVAYGVANFAVSPSGTLILAPRNNARLKMTWLDGQGTGGAAVGDPGPYANETRPALSPDGTRLVLSRPGATGSSDLWQVDLERNVSTRVAATSRPEVAPLFSHDGKHIVYSAGTGDLYRRLADGSGDEELLLASPLRKTPTAISPDGSVLLFNQAGVTTGADIWGLPLTGDRTPRPVVVTHAHEGYATFSPDGRWLAYCLSETGEADQVFIEPYPPTGARTRLSTTNGSSPRWSADGRTIYFGATTDQVMRVSVAFSGGSVRIGTPVTVLTAPTLFGHNAFVLDARSRIMAMAPDGDSEREPATVILNWAALLKE